MMHLTHAPTAPLLDELEAQLVQVTTINLVSKVYPSADQQTLVIELHINPALGIKHRNILFFALEGFKADQVYKAIARLKYLSNQANQPSGPSRPSLTTPAQGRKLRL